MADSHKYCKGTNMLCVGEDEEFKRDFDEKTMKRCPHYGPRKINGENKEGAYCVYILEQNSSARKIPSDLERIAKINKR